MPCTPDDLFAYLGDLGIDVVTVSHPPLFTVAESQALRGTIPGAHTKNLFLKDKKGAFFLITAEENATVDLKSIHQRIGASGRVSFGKPDDLMDKLGVAPGSVTVFGVLNDRDGSVRVILDQSLMASLVINAHPLINEATTAIAPGDLMRFLQSTGHEPLVLDLSA